MQIIVSSVNVRLWRCKWSYLQLMYDCGDANDRIFS